MTVKAYDNWEAAMADLEERIDCLNRALRPAQVAVRDTHDQQYVLGVAEDDLLLYGDIPAPEDIALRRKGYLTGTWYSGWLEDGEYGDNHVAVVLFSIPPSAFELARELGWPSLSEIRGAAGEPGTPLHTLAAKLAMAEAMASLHR